MSIKSTLFILMPLFFVSVLSSSAEALRCSGKIVSHGDTKLEVEKKCGEPSRMETWKEERLTERGHYYKYHSDPYKSKTHLPYGIKETFDMEKWTYNFGPTQFIRYLFFEKGKLTKIELGKRGFH